MLKKPVLGRGLGALIPGAEVSIMSAPAPTSAVLNSAPTTFAASDTTEVSLGMHRIPMQRIRVNPLQPRTEMDPARLDELAESIRERGVMQPILVRRAGDYFELVAGERRFQASRKLGLMEIPAVVREIADEEMLELALIENLQREDLNPVDEASGYRRLIEMLGITQEEAARRVGRDRTTVANSLRLLQLPAQVLQLLASGKVSAGHGRALLTLTSPEEMVRVATQIADKRLTVRAIEELGRVGKPARHKGRRLKKKQPPELVQVEEKLQQRFATRVRVAGTQHKGSISMEYYSLEELERLLEEMGISLA